LFHEQNNIHIHLKNGQFLRPAWRRLSDGPKFPGSSKEPLVLFLAGAARVLPRDNTSATMTSANIWSVQCCRRQLPEQMSPANILAGAKPTHSSLTSRTTPAAYLWCAPSTARRSRRPPNWLIFRYRGFQRVFITDIPDL